MLMRPWTGAHVAPHVVLRGMPVARRHTALLPLHAARLLSLHCSVADVRGGLIGIDDELLARIIGAFHAHTHTLALSLSLSLSHTPRRAYTHERTCARAHALTRDRAHAQSSALTALRQPN